MMMDRIKRWRWAIAVAALVLLGLAWAFWPEAQAVDVGKVSRGPMSVGVTDDGVTRAEEYYVVSAPVTGYLSRVELEPGDRVARGTLITHMAGRPSTPLDPRTRQELQGALAAAKAVERSSAASLAQAERDRSRAEEIAKRGFLSRAQLEATRTRAETTLATLQQSRAEVRRIEALLTQPGGPAGGASVPVLAPIGGSVLSVITESAGVIAEGTPLMTIGDPDEIEAVVDLLSREAVRVKPGDRVELTQWGGPEPLSGHVTRVEPFGRLKISALGIEEQRVDVIISFDDRRQAARLGHGYQIDATIIRWSEANALRVPVGALFRGPDGGWRVFVVKDGRTRERAVKIRHINDEFGEVLGGLAEGDEIVLNPGSSLRNGMRVTKR